jgi:hypothetical protein
MTRKINNSTRLETMILADIHRMNRELGALYKHKRDFIAESRERTKALQKLQQLKEELAAYEELGAIFGATSSQGE